MNRRQITAGLLIATVLAAIGGIWYVLEQQKYVFTEKAEVSAPLIQLGAPVPGILMRVSVEEGDTLQASQVVARVGDEVIRTQVAGIAVAVQKNIGAAFAAGQAVVTMIQPEELHVIARIGEDKGLKNVHVGQDVIFTVDAFGSKKFQGTVEAVSQTKRQGDVVFNISDKREEKEFDVKIGYDHELNPGLQNGMSARVWIVK
jgi:multidrug resistance efflux pump